MGSLCGGGECLGAWKTEGPRHALRSRLGPVAEARPGGDKLAMEVQTTRLWGSSRGGQGGGGREGGRQGAAATVRSVAHRFDHGWATEPVPSGAGR